MAKSVSSKYMYILKILAFQVLISYEQLPITIDACLSQKMHAYHKKLTRN